MHHIYPYFIPGCISSLHRCPRSQTLDLKSRILHTIPEARCTFQCSSFHYTPESRTWGRYLLSLGNRVDSYSPRKSKPSDGCGSKNLILSFEKERVKPLPLPWKLLLTTTHAMLSQCFTLAIGLYASSSASL